MDHHCQCLIVVGWKIGVLVREQCHDAGMRTAQVVRGHLKEDLPKFIV